VVLRITGVGSAAIHWTRRWRLPLGFRTHHGTDNGQDQPDSEHDESKYNRTDHTEDATDRSTAGKQDRIICARDFIDAIGFRSKRLHRLIRVLVRFNR